MLVLEHASPPSRKDLIDAGEEFHRWPANAQSVPMVTGSFRYVAAITPGASLIATPPDALTTSVDSNVTVLGSDDHAGTAVLIPMKAGVIYPISAAKVTIVSAGTCFGLWHRKPNP